MHTQVFCTSCPGMFQWSLSRVLMWVEEKGKNLAENESQGMRWSRGVDGRYLRKREERVCKVYLTEFIGDQRKVWRDDMMVTTGLTKDKKRWLGFSLPGYLIFLSALRNERKKGSTVKVLCGLLKTEQTLYRTIYPASELLRHERTHFPNFPGPPCKTPCLISTLVIV